MPFTLDVLKHGIILGSIAHAVWVSIRPRQSQFIYWEDNCYIKENGQGAKGVVAIDEDRCIAVFSYDESSRAPWIANKPPQTEAVLLGIPQELEPLKQEVLSYMVDEYDGIEGPIITSAFWTISGDFVSVDPWEKCASHGAYLLETETLPRYEDALVRWIREFGFTEQEGNLVARIFNLRTTQGSGILISKDMLPKIDHYHVEKLASCNDLFHSIGITIEK